MPIFYHLKNNQVLYLPNSVLPAPRQFSSWTIKLAHMFISLIHLAAWAAVLFNGAEKAAWMLPSNASWREGTCRTSYAEAAQPGQGTGLAEPSSSLFMSLQILGIPVQLLEWAESRFSWVEWKARATSPHRNRTNRSNPEVLTENSFTVLM